MEGSTQWRKRDGGESGTEKEYERERDYIESDLGYQRNCNKIESL